MAIQSYRCSDTRRLRTTGKSPRFGGIAKVALRKLDMLNAAVRLESLNVPPGNHLEMLTGDRVGQHSIRINQQWRLCFRWTAAGPADVEIVDYHR
jgi:proteic killer suppression protein